MSKKGRAKRTSGAPSSRPSVRAVADVEATKGSAPASASKEKASAEAPKSEAPKSEAPKSEAPNSEPPKSEAPKSEPPKAEASKSEPPRAEASKSEPPRAEASKSEPPRAEASKSEPPRAEASKSEPPKAEASKSEPPQAEAADVDDEAFFTQGVRKSSIPPAMEADPVDDRLVRLREDPEVLARRAQGLKWVKIALAGFGALLAVGAVMKALEAPPPKPKDPVFVHAEGTQAPSAAVSAEPAPSASPSATASTAVTADAASGATLDAGSDAASAVDAAQAVAAPSDLDAGLDAAVDAKALKKACQRALDGGKANDAIAKCEASTAADPTDGEAWLLLGASYDQAGRKADARAAYQSCVQKGKRGPTGECAALLRQ